MARKLLLATLLIMSLALAGCITLKVDTSIKADGSGSKSLSVAIDDSVLQMTQTLTPGTPQPGVKTPHAEDPFKELRDQAKGIPGATVEPYTDPVRKRTGVKMTVPFKNLDELVALSKNEPFQGMDEIKVEKSGNTYTMRIKVFTQNVGQELSGTPKPKATGPAPTMDPQAAAMLKAMNIEFTYSIAVAGKILKYDPPGELNEKENRVTWPLDVAAASQEITFQWQAGGILPPAAPTATPAVGPKAPTAPPAAATPTKGLLPIPGGKPALPCCPIPLPLGILGGAGGLALVLAKKLVVLSV